MMGQLKKNIVKDSYVLPINIDPAKLIFNDIKVLGGYFQFYRMVYFLPHG